jgi:hypothetical protein
MMSAMKPQNAFMAPFADGFVGSAPRTMNSAMQTVRSADPTRIGLLFTLIFILLSGCVPPAPPASHGYYGATLPLEKVVRNIDDNNLRLPTLWARVKYFEATEVDRATGKVKSFINGDQGTLLYTSPDSIRLTVNKQVADLFVMGSDASQFWFDQPHDKIYYWGKYADIGSATTSQIPIRPDLVMEVLGVRPLDTNLLSEPAPVLRFNNDADVYMIVWQKHSADRWVAQKEIWYDRQTLLPTTVLLFDANGRVVLRAWLSNFVAVKTSDSPAVNDPAGAEAKAQQPKVASHYRLFFPESDTHATFDLVDIALNHNGFPRPASYGMRNIDELAESGYKVKQINAETQP